MCVCVITFRAAFDHKPGARATAYRPGPRWSLGLVLPAEVGSFRPVAPFGASSDKVLASSPFAGERGKRKRTPLV